MTRQQHTRVSNQQEWRPEQRGTHRKVIVEMTCRRAESGDRLTGFVETRLSKAFVGGLVIVGEIQAVFDKGGPRISVIADAVSMNNRIQQGKGGQEEKE